MAKNQAHILRNGKEILDLEQLSINIDYDGIKLKEEISGTRIYHLTEACSPPYEIIWYPPNVVITARVSSLVDWMVINHPDKNDFTLIGLPKPWENLKLQLISTSNLAQYVELEFQAFDLPSRPSEKVLK